MKEYNTKPYHSQCHMQILNSKLVLQLVTWYGPFSLENKIKINFTFIALIKDQHKQAQHQGFSSTCRYVCCLSGVSWMVNAYQAGHLFFCPEGSLLYAYIFSNLAKV